MSLGGMVLQPDIAFDPVFSSHNGSAGATGARGRLRYDGWYDGAELTWPASVVVVIGADQPSSGERERWRVPRLVPAA
jgi:hypothetical protein